MRHLWGDVRYSSRVLAKAPGVTVVAATALALGIGANTAIFSVVNAVLLKPLPFNEPDQLVTMRIDLPERNIQNALGPYPDIADWRQQSRSFSFLAAYSPGSANLITRDEPQHVSLWRMNASLFPMLGVKMTLGRAFLPEEDQPGSARVVVMSHSLWQRRFASDVGLVGRPLQIDGAAYTVVGILPSGFQVETEPVDLYTPIALSGTRVGNGEWMFGGFARLKPAVSIQQAQAELDTIYQRLEKQYPREIKGFRPHIWGLREFMVRDVKLSLIVLLAAVALVLLIACANVANLLLARSGARQKEVAIRAALGAGRWRVLRQFLVESVLLALLGGAAGLLLAYWGVQVLGMLGAEELPMLKKAHIDLPVLGFTILITMLTGLVFGMAPGMSALGTKVHNALNEAGRGSTESRARSRLRSLLVVSEVALSLLLLIGASLMIRSLLKLQQVNPGFSAGGVLTASIDLPASKYSNAEQQNTFYQQLQERLEATPGVTAAGMVSVLPLSGNNQGWGLLVEGHPISTPSDVPILFFRMVNTRYFPAMKIPLRKGRLFNERDNQGAPRVLIVNETLARRYWPNQDPIGKRIGSGAPDGWMSVVGVVGDVRHTSLARDADAEIFVPLTQNARPDMNLVVRTSSDPLHFAPILRRAVMDLDRDLPVSRVASMEQTLTGSIAKERFSALLLGIFAGVALILAAIGIYGVISYSVIRRTNEIGVRITLGASSSDVLRMVVGQGMLLTLAGVAIGLSAALALTRVIRSLLFGVGATDPWVFLGVALLLGAVAVLASYLPARRAVRIDPNAALRYE